MADKKENGKCINYDIHGLIRVKSNVPIGIPSIFETKDAIEPDLIVEVRDFNVDKEINENDIYYYEDYGNLSKLLLKNISSKKAEIRYINIGYKITGRINKILESLIKEVMQMKLIQKGYCFLHCACLDINGKGLLITAPPETGKTFTAIALVKNHNLGYLSDDMTIVGKNIAYCYPLPLTLHSYHIKAHKIKLSTKIYIRMHVINFLKKIPLVNTQVPEFSLDIRDIVNNVNIKKSTKINTICFLKRGSDEISEVDKDYALKMLSLVGGMHIPFYDDRLILTYAYNDPLLDVENILNMRRKLYTHIIDNAECILIKSKNREFSKLIERFILPKM